ncbi:MAG TPA: hypothetical protein VH478_03605 [Trebonia sp.]|jgi:hypothetical protein|nr:hypothetical protein [Trebonia sp.]
MADIRACDQCGAERYDAYQRWLAGRPAAETFGVAERSLRRAAACLAQESSLTA